MGVYVPAAHVVADVRNTPPLLERRGRHVSNRAHRVVRSSNSLVLVQALENRQRVEQVVNAVQPALASADSASHERGGTERWLKVIPNKMSKTRRSMPDGCYRATGG